MPTFHTHGVAYLGKLEISWHVRSKFPMLSQWRFPKNLHKGNLRKNSTLVFGSFSVCYRPTPRLSRGIGLDAVKTPTLVPRALK